MTLDQIKRTKPPTVTIQDAAKIMGVTPLFLQYSLQQDRFPFGTATKMEKRWRYYIHAGRFIQYMEGSLIQCQDAKPTPDLNAASSL